MTPQPVSLLCQYSTGILGPREEGGREAGREAGGRAGGRGGTEEGRKGEERTEEQSKCRSCAVPAVLSHRGKGPSFIISLSWFVCVCVCACLCGGVLGLVVFTGVQRSSVKAVEPSCHLTYE